MREKNRRGKGVRTIYIADIIEAEKTMKSACTNEEYFYCALMSLNESILQIAVSMPIGDENRTALLQISKMCIPARFEGFVEEGWNDIKDDEVAKEFVKAIH